VAEVLEHCGGALEQSEFIPLDVELDPIAVLTSQTWRVARSLLTMRDQVNRLAPARRRASDGTIGDASHQNRSSDHNPWVPPPKGGVVTALDLTHDPQGGFDAHAYAEELRKSRDPRIKYVISNGRIFSSTVSPWQWRPYSGPNPHRTHIHISAVSSPQSRWDSTAPWPGLPTTPSRNWLQEGDRGESVRTLQAQLRTAGFDPGPVDGIFGPQTTIAVRRFQAAAGITVDGLAGPQTQVALKNWKSEAHVDYEVVVVWANDLDQGMALTLGAILGIAVLRVGHVKRARRAFLVGSAATASRAPYDEARILAGPNRGETALAVAQLIEDYYDAGRPRRLRALTF
jgi:hypothetical protein